MYSWVYYASFKGGRHSFEAYNRVNSAGGLRFFTEVKVFFEILLDVINVCHIGDKTTIVGTILTAVFLAPRRRIIQRNWNSPERVHSLLRSVRPRNLMTSWTQNSSDFSETSIV